MILSDPNYFWRAARARRRPAGTARDPHPTLLSRTAIIAASELPISAQAIRTGRAHRASGALAYHVLEVMEAFQRASD